MLQYLYRYQTNTAIRKIWIDAICINQANSEEKNTQIPLMCDIYTQAATVVVWMGLSTPDTDVFITEFQEVKVKLKKWIAHHVADSDFRNPTTGELPDREEAFWGGLYHLLNSTWFERLWTYQEIVLANTAILLCGELRVDFDEFILFIDDGYFSSSYIPAQLKAGSSRTVDISLITCKSITYPRDRLAHRPRGTKIRFQAAIRYVDDVAGQLNELRYRQVKEPVDRVWAIVGLLENHLKKRLTPYVDYSAQGRKEYWKTWILFAKALIDEPDGIKLLLVPPALEPKPPGLPSWCPSLSGESTCDMRITEPWNASISRRSLLIKWALFEENSDKRSVK
jgi:hypothetical protein